MLQKKGGKRFIEILREAGNVSKAAQEAGFSRQAFYAYRKKNPEFKKLWDEAIEQAIDKLEAEAWRRAKDGIEKPIVHQGQVIGHYREYSDRLLEILLKAYRPNLFEGKSGAKVFETLNVIEKNPAQLLENFLDLTAKNKRKPESEGAIQIGGDQEA